MTEKRIFMVNPEPLELNAQNVNDVKTMHDGPHLELYYNLIFSDREDFVLPAHLRPVCWALADKVVESLMVIISPGSGKSFLTGIAFPTWELGLDHNMTILGISSGADLMVNWVQSSMDIIESSAMYHLIFPDVRPDKEMGWSTSRGVYIKREAAGLPSPSYAGTGIGAKSVTGKHARMLVVDDIHDSENSSNSDQIEKVEDFYYKTLIGRQDPLGSRMIMVGRRWASDDLYGRLNTAGDWLTMTLANFRDTEELYYDVRIPANLACIFNEYTAQPVVEDIKVVYGSNADPKGFFWVGELGKKTKLKEVLTIKKNKPSVYETVYQSNPESAGTRIFRDEDFQDFTVPEDMQLGRSYSTVADFMYHMNFDMLVQTWDTALTAESDNDPSVGYTVGLKGCAKDHRSIEPNPEEVPFHYDLYVLDENYKRLTFGDFKQEAIDYFHLWNPNQVLVEKSLPGIPLINSLQSDSIPVIGIVVQHTSKRGRAISGAKAGSAQGWARQGRIWIPRNAPWAAGLIGELKDFTGARNKRDDRVDALIQAANFAIDYGVQSRELPEGWRTDKEIDTRLARWAVPEHPLAHLQYMVHNVQNPLYGLCGSCKNYVKDTSYCGLHKRTVIKLGSCYLYDPVKDVTQIIDASGEPIEEK